MAHFDGFGQETVSFLAGISEHNEKPWFDENRETYRDHYVGAAVDFIDTIAPLLKKLAPGIQADPKVNGSLFRINRDVRFAKDKRPYKDHIDLWFWQGERKTPLSALFMRITAERLIIGTGVHVFTPGQLTDYRQALVNKTRAGALLDIEKSLAAGGLELQGEHYKSVPRGLQFADTHLERLSKFNALYAAYDEPHPASLGSASFVNYCIDRWNPLMPLHRWLVGMGS